MSLPAPGTMVPLSPAVDLPVLKGIKVHPNDPMQLDFVLDQQSKTKVISDAEAKKLVKYFLASLTTPEQEMWVNLSPYEKDRIVPESFGQTEMGRDLLAQDYLLKQITASLVYPEGDIGKQFWKRVYELSGNKNLPVNTFNKVWIVPDKAVVYENAKAGTAYVVESSLKVLTEQDYLAQERNAAGGAQGVRYARSDRGTMALSSATPRGDGWREDETNTWATGPAHAIRDLVIPQLTKEVNTGANFAQLRQVYNSLILATWYKKKIKDSILSQVYADKNKVDGITIDDPKEKERIYAQYLEAFKKGAYNFIKEERDQLSGQMVPRKYFSGGVTMLTISQAMVASTKEPGDIKDLMQISIQLQTADQAQRAKETKPRIRRSNSEVAALKSRMKDLLDKGKYSARQLAEALDISVKTAENYVFLTGFLADHPNLLKVREDRPQAEIDADIQKVRFSLKQGPRTVRQIADETGLNVSLIWTYINTYKDLASNPNLKREKVIVMRSKEQIAIDRKKIRELIESRPVTINDITSITKIKRTVVEDDVHAMGLEKHPNFKFIYNVKGRAQQEAVGGREDDAMTAELQVLDPFGLEFQPREGVLKYQGQALRPLGSEASVNFNFDFQGKYDVRISMDPEEATTTTFEEAFNFFNEAGRLGLSPQVYQADWVAYGDDLYRMLVVGKIIGYSFDQVRASDQVSLTIGKRTEYFIDLLKKMIGGSVLLTDWRPSQFMFGYDANDSNKEVRAWLVDADELTVDIPLTASQLAMRYAVIIAIDGGINPVVVDTQQIIDALKQMMTPADVNQFEKTIGANKVSRADSEDNAQIAKTEELYNTVTLERGARMLTPLRGADLKKMMDQPQMNYIANDASKKPVVTPITKQWKYVDTSWEEINARLDVLRAIEEIYAKRLDKTKPIVILDWGAGTGEAMVGLHNILVLKKIPHQIYGLSHDYFSQWNNAPGDMTFILDDGMNLPKYFGEGSIDLIYSSLGLKHLIQHNKIYRQETGNVNRHIKDLMRMLRAGGMLRIEKFTSLTIETYPFVYYFTEERTSDGFDYSEYRKDSAQLASDLSGPEFEVKWDEYAARNKLNEYPLLLQQFPKEIKEALLDDSVLRPVFVQLLPESGMDDIQVPVHAQSIVAQLVGGRSLLEYMKDYSFFTVGTAKVAEQILREGKGRILIAVTDKESFEIIGNNYRVANGRQVYVPLLDGTWLGIKGSGQNKFLDRSPLYSGKVERIGQVDEDVVFGIASEREAKNAYEYTRRFDGRHDWIVEFLGYRRIHLYPDGDGRLLGVNAPFKSRGEDVLPAIIFNRVFTPHRLNKFYQLIMAGDDFDHVLEKMTTALQQASLLAKDDRLDKKNILSKSFENMGRIQAKKQSLGLYKRTIHSQDFTLFGFEADNEEFCELEEYQDYLKRHNATFIEDSILLSRYGLSIAGLKVGVRFVFELFEALRKSHSTWLPDIESHVKSMFDGYFAEIDERYRQVWRDNLSAIIFQLRRGSGFHFVGEGGKFWDHLEEYLRNKLLMDGDKGGIDLNPSAVDMGIKASGSGITMTLDQKMLEQLQNAAGFVPVIINITPIPSLKTFLNS